MQNERVVAEDIYVPLLLQAISGWKKKRIYLVLDTMVLWNQYCLVSLAMVTGGRAVPFLWLALEHSSASVAWGKYQPLLEKTRQYLQDYEDVMFLADRDFPFGYSFSRTLFPLIFLFTQNLDHSR